MENVFDELNKIDDEYSLNDYSDEDLKKILRSIKKNRPDLLDDADDAQELAAAMTKYLDDVLGPDMNTDTRHAESKADEADKADDVDEVKRGVSLVTNGELILDSDAANNYTFNGIRGLRRVKVTSATAIRDNMFEGCVNLAEVIFAEDCPLEVIGNNSFSDCAIKHITLPSGVKKIGESAFQECMALESIKINEGVTTIGKGAFRVCKQLKNIVIPDSVTSIGAGAFESCVTLRSIKLSDNITEIAYYLFENCTSVIEIVVPDKVTVIRPGAFRKCISLRRVTLPEGVKLANWPFSSLRLSDIIFKGTTQKWKAVAGKKNLPVDRIICTDGKIILNQGYDGPYNSDDA